MFYYPFDADVFFLLIQFFGLWASLGYSVYCLLSRNINPMAKSYVFSLWGIGYIYGMVASGYPGINLLRKVLKELSREVSVYTIVFLFDEFFDFHFSFELFYDGTALFMGVAVFSFLTFGVFSVVVCSVF